MSAAVAPAKKAPKELLKPSIVIMKAIARVLYSGGAISPIRE
jgi:hypothetical protein